MYDNNDNFKHLIRKYSDEKDNSNPFKNKPKEEYKFTDSLSNYVKHRSLPESQIMLVRELLKCKNPEKAKGLQDSTLRVLLNDSNLGVRKIIAWAYRFQKSKNDSANLLSERLKKESNWIVKQEILNSLVEIGVSIIEKSDLKFRIMTDIFSHLNDKRHPVRLSAIAGVVRLNITEARYKIQEMAESDPVDSVRVKAKLVFEKLSNLSE